jgi:DNA-binding transcriptional MocR family regulator
MTNWKPDLQNGSDGPIYVAIADALSEDIAEGRLARGQRLPTHRALAQTIGVTVGTVSRAYAEAERRGLVIGEVGRGTFVRQEGAEDEWYRAGFGDGVELVDLGRNFPVGLPDHEDDLVARSLRELASRPNLSEWLRYPDRSGTCRQRAGGVAWVERTGLEASRDRVIVSSGVQHGLTVIFSTLTRPGDLVLADSVTYPGMKALAQMLHLRLRGLPMDEDGLRPEAFERACETELVRALYCIPTIQNPTTYVMSQARRREIARIAEKHGILVVEDDSHAMMASEPPLPIAAHAPHTTCYLAGTSKCLAPGLRVGYILAPEPLVQRLETGIRATTWMAAPLMAELTADWILDGTADMLLARRREETVRRRCMADSILVGLKYDSHPEGPHMWLHLPEPWRSSDFVAQARQRGILITGAEAFAVGREAIPHAVRLALGPPRSGQELERALRTMAEILEGQTDPCLSCP